MVARLRTQQMASVSTAMRGEPGQDNNAASDLKKICERTVQGFCSAVKSSISCIPPLLPRRNGDHFSSVVNRMATWPRRASRRLRERASPNAQLGSDSPAGGRHCRSFPAHGLPFASLTVNKPHSQYNSDIFKTSRPCNSSNGGDEQEEEEMATVGGTATASQVNAPPFCDDASLDDDIMFWNTQVENCLQEFGVEDDFQMYMMKGILELEQKSCCCSAPAISPGNAWTENLTEFDRVVEYMSTAFASESQHEGAGDSSVTTVSENETASSAVSSQELLQKTGVQEAGHRYRGTRQKEEKWVSEIRPTGSKKTVWLGTYATEEEAARAFDAGVFYYGKSHIPYNFPDSPQVLPTINEKPQDVCHKFVKNQARRNAERAWPSSGTADPQHPSAILEQTSSSRTSRGCFQGGKRRKSNSQLS